MHAAAKIICKQCSDHNVSLYSVE